MTIILQKKTALPFSPRQPGYPPPADPQLSVPRLLEVWLYLGIKEKPPKEYPGSSEGFMIEFFEKSLA
jgi:hypothetical protein